MPAFRVEHPATGCVTGTDLDARRGRGGSGRPGDRHGSWSCAADSADELCDGRANLARAVFLQEVETWYGHLGLVRPRRTGAGAVQGGPYHRIANARIHGPTPGDRAR